MNVLLVSGTAPPLVQEVDGELLVVAHPLTALHGYRFDLIVVRVDHPGGVGSKAYEEWWNDTVLCRLSPYGRLIEI